MSTETIRLEACPQPCLFAEPDWFLVKDLQREQAEHLLDWLENNGYEQREVSASTNGLLAVSFCSLPDTAP